MDTECSGIVKTLFQDNNHHIKSSENYNHGHELEVEAQKVLNTAMAIILKCYLLLTSS